MRTHLQKIVVLILFRNSEADCAKE